MEQSQSNGLEPSQPQLLDVTTFAQDSIEHANEELMQERIQSKTIEDLIMIAQDTQAFVNDEDAIFETKIVSRKQNKSPMSIKNSSPASRQKVLASKQKISTPMRPNSF